MVISNFQLDSVIGYPTENPCVSGSVPSLAKNQEPQTCRVGEGPSAPAGISLAVSAVSSFVPV
jgi:hypothetical protein